jgi:hypothetical protein
MADLKLDEDEIPKADHGKLDERHVAPHERILASMDFCHE